MSDLDGQDFMDDNEVEMVDLGAPREGLSAFLFAFGKRMRFVAQRRTRLILLFFLTGALLLLLFQPSYSLFHKPAAATIRRIPTTTPLAQHALCQIVNTTATSGEPWDVTITYPTSQGTNACFLIISTPGQLDKKQTP